MLINRQQDQFGPDSKPDRDNPAVLSRSRHQGGDCNEERKVYFIRNVRKDKNICTSEDDVWGLSREIWCMPS